MSRLIIAEQVNMMARWFKNSTWPIGCTFGARHVRMVQMQTDENRGNVLCTGTCSIDATDGIDSPDWAEHAGDAICRVLKNNAFVGRRAVICLGSDRVQYRHLRMAPMPDDELGTAIRWRVAKDLEANPEEMCCDFFDIGEVTEGDKKKREVVAVCADLSDIERHISAARHANLEVTGIDASIGAIGRCLPVRQPGVEAAGGDSTSAEAVLVVEISESATVMSVIHDLSPRLIRTVEIGRENIIKQAASNAGLNSKQCDELRQLFDGNGSEQDDQSLTSAMQSVEDACAAAARELSHQIALCMGHLSQNRLVDLRPAAGFVLGAGALTTVMIRELNETTNIDFRPVGDLLSPAVRALMDNESFEQWLIPIGLALYGREELVQGVAA